MQGYPTAVQLGPNMVRVRCSNREACRQLALFCQLAPATHAESPGNC
jgi:hypothetical protein